jgi:phytoene synthase
MGQRRDDQTKPQPDSVRSTAKALAPDLYVAALLAPADVRDDLMALAAFWGETGRIALSVSDAALGEIRLRWWVDAMDPGAGDSGHPVADAMRGAVVRHAIAATQVQGLIEARRHELYRLPFPDEAAFDRYLVACDGALFALAAHVRGVRAQAPSAATDLAGRACGRVRVGLDLPFFAAMSRLPLWPAVVDETGAGEANQGAARDMVARLATQATNDLRQLRNILAGATASLIDAVLPAALLEPYLRALETNDDPLRTVASIAPLTRLTRLTWAHLRGRI